MHSLFDSALDYAQDVFRNIRGIKESQHLFDDLSDDPKDWEAANHLEMDTHPSLQQAALIQRGFDYSLNEFIEYPFEYITSSRYSDGSVPCWYGSENLETSIAETKYHFIQEMLSSWQAVQHEKTVTIDRRVALVFCHGLAFDLSKKQQEFPWLVAPDNYESCQEIGLRVAKEGHPLLRVPSARQKEGINLVVFKPKILSNPRDYCKLQYIFNVATKEVLVYRGAKALV